MRTSIMMPSRAFACFIAELQAGLCADCTTSAKARATDFCEFPAHPYTASVRVTRFRLLLAGLVVSLLAACDSASPPQNTPVPVETAAPSATAAAPLEPRAVPLSARNGVIVASVFRQGHWDIYAVSAQGELLKRYTFGEGDNRSPAWSPDGSQIAFASSREHNW